MHATRENIEGLLRYKQEIKKVKSGGRSTNHIHAESKTSENFIANLTVFRWFSAETVFEEYSCENINLIPLPWREPTGESEIKINLD